MSDRKFVFDWDENEDTSRDVNPIYADKHNAQLFGRGHFAGFDIVQQKKKNGEFYEKLAHSRKNETESEMLE